MIDSIEQLVREERDRQNAKWGQQNHPDGTGELMKWDADCARRICDNAFGQGRGTWKHIFDEEVCEAVAESDQEKLKTELIQVMAVCKAWIECIDRRKEQKCE